MMVGMAQEKAPSNIAVMVDEQAITKEELFDFFLKKYRIDAHEVINEAIIHWLIREESKREGITIQRAQILPKMEEEIAKIKEEVPKKYQQNWDDYLKSQGLTEKDFRQEVYSKWKYRLALDRLILLSQCRETKLEAQHILVSTQAKARQILQKLKQNTDFTTLARQESGKDGVHLLVLYRGDLSSSLTALEDAAFSLKLNEISGIIESRWGYHIIQVTKILPGKPYITWAQAQSEIMEALTKIRLTPQDVQRWLKKMGTKHKIKKMF